MGTEENKEITNSAFFTPAQQEVLQQNLLKKQAEIWLSNTNYFRQRLLNAGIDKPENISLEKLKTIPTLHKDELAIHYKKMQTPHIAVGDYCTTSGTTGKPVTIPLTYNDIDRLGWNEAISYQCMDLTDNDVIMLCTTIDRTFMAGLAYLEGARKLKIPMVRAGIINPGMHWEYIKQYEVTTLVSVPSYLLKLLTFAKENGIDPNHTTVKKILCIGEAVRDENDVLKPASQKILEQWNTQLFGTYASTEMQTAFTECKHSTGMHHIPGLIICEILDEEGNEVPIGEAGELVITHLGVEGMPLVRFRTGDICIGDSSPCDCGRHSLRIKTITGRKNSMLKLKGTTLYPTLIIDTLSAESHLEDFIVVAKKDENQNDLVEVMICGNIEEQSLSLLEAKLRVTPTWIKAPLKEIEDLRAQRPSRKIQRFIDLR